MDDNGKAHMARAIELAKSTIDRPGTRPYAAVVVKDGAVVGEGINQAIAKHDPTSHGEIEAIRNACRNLQTTDLSGCEIYATCEPCPICVAVIYRANICRLYYAVSAEDDEQLAGIAASHRFEAAQKSLSNVEIGQEVATAIAKRMMPSRQMMANEGLSVLVAWRKSQRLLENSE